MHASSVAIYRRTLSAALIAAVLAMFSLSLAYGETGGRLPLLLLVRHADKLTGKADDDDPPLSSAGRKRAEELATALRESGVNASSQWSYVVPAKRLRRLPPSSP